MRGKPNKGFTLVETIVVLVTLAILAGIMIPAMVSWIDEANERKCITYRGSLTRHFAATFAEDYGIGTQKTVRTLLAETVSSDGYGWTVGGGDASPSITGLCPNGGVITATDLGGGLIRLDCSVHDGGGITYTTNEQIGAAVKQAFDAAASTLVGVGASTNYYEGVVTRTTKDYYDAVLAALPSDLRAALDGKSWTIKASKNMTSFQLYIYNGDVASPSTPSIIEVDVYDSVTGTTTKKHTYKGMALDVDGTSKPIVRTDYVW